MTMNADQSADDLRAMIEANLKHATAARVRELFNEINPHLVGEKLFEKRWSDLRKDAAVLIPLIPRPRGIHVILTVRASDMPSHAGQISFPGGKTQPEDEDVVATALREAHEEVNIPPEAVDVIGALGVHKGGLGFSVTPVVGLVAPDAPLQPCPREVGEIFEVPLDFIADLSNHITEERTLEGVPYKMFAAPYGRYHIWGLTAGILRSFAEILQPEPRA
ncbi:CoA pyrophosphatase [Hyphococcus luteus]|uniref:CoA pyrophosphatase n=1 Tax=Hyphococcus luteus TaxID=2058213 RepID=A0A2S7K9Z9_9PROT|nr:CoA pyrophosphatase [Marinicaulis flavus]PQA89317.1 CoA pyrophosphatase [Marinicaulis flavus]